MNNNLIGNHDENSKNMRISSGDYVYAIHLLSQLIVITWMCDHSRCCKLKLRHHYRRSNNFSYLVIFGLNKICVTKTQFTWLRHRWSLKLILNFLRSRTKILGNSIFRQMETMNRVSLASVKRAERLTRLTEEKSCAAAIHRSDGSSI